MPLRRTLVIVLWALTVVWAIVGAVRYVHGDIHLREATAGTVAAVVLVVLSLAVAPRPPRRPRHPSPEHPFEGGRPAYGYVFLSVREYEMLARRALAAGPEPAHVSLCGARTRFDGHWYVCGLPDGHEAAGVRGHTGPREGMLAWES